MQSNKGNEKIDPAGTPESSLKRWSSFLSTLKFFALVIITVLIVKTFIFQSYRVFGQSMEPTLSHGDQLLVSKLGKTSSKILGRDYVPKRGEIVVFNDPFFGDRPLIKRVIGLPGERVVLIDGKLRIYNDENPDGLDPDSIFEHKSLDYTDGEVDIRVPEGHVFVIGDNRDTGGSLDSRNDLGPISTKNITGDLIIRLFPLSKIELF